MFLSGIIITQARNTTKDYINIYETSIDPHGSADSQFCSDRNGNGNTCTPYRMENGSHCQECTRHSPKEYQVIRYMKHITFRKWLLPLCMAATCLSASAVDLKTRFATFRVDKKGYIVKMTNLQTGKDYVPKGHPSPIIQLYDGKDYLAPIKLAANGNRWLLTFSNGSVATVNYADEGTYIRMQLEALTKRDHIQAICWGPYATTLSKYIGETVGVVRDGEFAIGVQPLQISTSEGRPHLGDDASGGYYVRPLP